MPPTFAPTPALAPVAGLFEGLFTPARGARCIAEGTGAFGSVRSASSLLTSELAPVLMVCLPTFALPAMPAPTWAKAGSAIDPAKITAVIAVNVRFIWLLLSGYDFGSERLGGTAQYPVVVRCVVVVVVD